MKKPSSRYRYENLVFNMKTQSNKEQKDDMWSIIEKITEKITKLLGVVIPFSILIGASFVYVHLKKLGAVSLFAEIISTPSSTIPIIIMFSIIMVVVFVIPFYMPYVFILNFKDKGDTQITKRLWWLSLLPTLILILNILLKIYYKTNYPLYNYDLYVNIFLLFILPFITVFFAIKRYNYNKINIKRYNYNKIKICKQIQSIYNKKDKVIFQILVVIVCMVQVIRTLSFKKIISAIVLIPVIVKTFSIVVRCIPIITGTIFRFLELFINYLLLNLCPILFIYFFTFLSTSWLTWDDNIFSISSIYSIIISIIMLFAYIMNLYLTLSIKNDKQVNSNDLLFPIIVILSIGCVIIAASHSKVSTNLFLNLGYIEKNTDARWYLLDTRFINQNGLVKKEGTTGLNDKDTLIEWRKKFPVNNNIDKYQTDYSKIYKNAVYGYMAWNLGKTKIFCPHDVTIENKKTLDKICLTINGDYLQPIPDDLPIPDGLRL